MNGYYSVFNPRGEKIADCGIERDAVNLMNMRNRRWDGHYFTFNPLPVHCQGYRPVPFAHNHKVASWHDQFRQ